MNPSERDNWSIACRVLDAAGAAGGIDEVRRIAAQGWTGDVDRAPASPELLQAIRECARAVVGDEEITEVAADARRPYASPELRYLGKVSDLTGGAAGSVDDGSGGLREGGTL